MNNYSSNKHNCIVCGDSGYSILENPILFCYTCKGNLNEEQMMRIQKALQNSDLTEFREELKRAKDWSEDLINKKNFAINRLEQENKQLRAEKARQYDTISNYQNKIKQLTESRNGNIMMLNKAQELGLEALIENHKMKKVISGLRANINQWFKDNKIYDTKPVMSAFDSIVREDDILQKLEECYK